MHEHLFITKLNTFPMICQFIIVYIKLKLTVNWSSQKGAHAMSETVSRLPGATETRRNADAADFSAQKGRTWAKKKQILYPSRLRHVYMFCYPHMMKEKSLVIIPLIEF